MRTSNPLSFIPFFDMAVEANRFLRGSANLEIHGVGEKTEDDPAFHKTVITIENKEGAEALKRPVGSYITIESKDVSEEKNESRFVSAIAESIGEMLPENDDAPVLVCGIGNPRIIADSLGSSVLSMLLATRSASAMPVEHGGRAGAVRPVALLTPDVFGNTGIESAEMIRAVAGIVKPEAILIIDALATTSVSRLGRSVQITDTGITPGGGIGNHRPEIGKALFHVPVIAIGVPTVIYPQAIIGDFFSRLETKDEKTASLIGEAVSNYLSDMSGDAMADFAVTPKDIDATVAAAARRIAGGIEIALHEEINAANYRSYLR